MPALDYFHRLPAEVLLSLGLFVSFTLAPDCPALW